MATLLKPQSQQHAYQPQWMEALLLPVDHIGSPVISVSHRLKLMFEKKLSKSKQWKRRVTMPSKRALSAFFKVKEGTIEKALDELRHQGYGIDMHDGASPIRMYNDFI